MYTKKILSVAAAVAVMSTGAMAFESYQGDANSTSTGGIRIDTTNRADINGSLIVTEVGETGKKHFVLSSYDTADKADHNISLSGTYKGNALIYPAFNQKEGWGTEIIVRNVKDKAIVAKAVLYGGEDSHEVVDFNIYLSAKDVCRFTIEDNKIKSTDGSIRTFGIHPHQVKTKTEGRGENPSEDLTDYRLIEFADTKPLELDVDEPFGYVAIYGMEQSPGVTDYEKADGSSTHVATPTGFHNDHAGLYAAYAASLDENRSGWRTVKDTNVGSITNGLFTSRVNAAPNIKTGPVSIHWEKWVDATTNQIRDYNTTFCCVANNSMTGQARIYSSEEGADMLINATAINNFTSDGNNSGIRMLWTEGEYASIADRCIAPSNQANQVFYDKECVKNDAAQFMISNAVYTFANATGSVKENKILITQPYKRILAQLDNPTITINGTDYKYNGSSNKAVRYDPDNGKYQKVATGTSYDFRIAPTPYDEDENTNTQAIGGTIITSPVSTGSNPVKFNNELQELNAVDMEKNPGFNGTFDNKNGFVDFTVPVAAITSQMVGSVVGSSAEMNWVYTDNDAAIQ